MSPAEIVLRVGGSLGSLLVFSAYTLTVSALTRAGCRSVSDENLAGTAILGGATLLALGLAGLALPWRRSARGGAVLALLLAGVLVWHVAPALVGSTLAGEPLCDALAPAVDPSAEPAIAPEVAPGIMLGITASPLERAWPLLHASVALLGAAQAIRFLRTPDQTPRDPDRRPRP